MHTHKKRWCNCSTCKWQEACTEEREAPVRAMALTQPGRGHVDAVEIEKPEPGPTTCSSGSWHAGCAAPICT